MNPRVTKAIPKNNYQVELKFTNGEERSLMLRPIWIEEYSKNLKNQSCSIRLKL